MSITTVRSEGQPFQEDASFYVWGEIWGEGHTFVAEVTNGDRTIYVYCDGEMRINLWESKEACLRGDDPEVIRYSDDLCNAGIDTDKKLSDAFEEGRLEWINNAWFDLYADAEGITDGWLNAVNHELNEAISQATGLIRDDQVWLDLKDGQ